MLYDPKWEVEVKADPFSLESLIAWLEKRPADETYCFSNWGSCLLARWMQSIDPCASAPLDDLTKEQPTGFHYAVNGQIVDLRAFQRIASGGLNRADWTFGSALERARVALPLQP